MDEIEKYKQLQFVKLENFKSLLSNSNSAAEKTRIEKVLEKREREREQINVIVIIFDTTFECERARK